MPVYALIAVLLVSTIASVRINVLLTYYANDVFTALQVAFEGAAVGRNEVKDSGINGFWLSMIIFAILGDACPALSAGHVPDAAVHHALANLVELRFVEIGSATSRTTVVSSCASRSTTPINAFNKNRRLHRRRRRRKLRLMAPRLCWCSVPSRPCCPCSRSAASSGTCPDTDLGQLHTAQSALLDRHRLRVSGHHRCVCHWQAFDPVELLQRTSQRWVPICARASEGFERRDWIYGGEPRTPPPFEQGDVSRILRRGIHAPVNLHQGLRSRVSN